MWALFGHVPGQGRALLIDPNRLAQFDRLGYNVLEAISPEARESATTHSRPHTFVGIDGRTYWVKAIVQQGLGSPNP